MKELTNGWILDRYAGAVCYFEHYPYSEAKKKADKREEIHVVETINFSLVENDNKEEEIHSNKYFALSLSDAIAMAARMEIEFREVAEEVIAIRVATDEEAQLYLKVSTHFDELMPSAISLEKAQALPTL